jgi:hypothetical protein
MDAEMHTADVGASEEPSCDLLLMVSNQSYLDDPVVLTVAIDGVDVLSQPLRSAVSTTSSAFRSAWVRARTIEGRVRHRSGSSGAVHAS